ncbi:hypothetical protein FACS1894199_06540 [Bacteroidia bacterium]|nr:hypothetical protein FACS1894199_06540 [Bacteroidia bacterium]
MNKNQFIQRLFAVMILTAVVAFQVKAEVKLPAVFGDNMVLQQQSQVAGWTTPTEKHGLAKTNP